MRRAGLAGLLLLLGVAVASAQMLDVRKMHGIPRPEPKLPAGSVTVRLIRGSLAKVAVGVEVTLIGKGSFGAERKATTDSQGRARFDGLPLDASDVQAKATVDTLPLESQTFALPQDMGIALLLTTPPAPGDIPKEPTDDAAGMPQPGEMHGIPLADAKIPLGTLSVVVVRSTMLEKVTDTPVDLIGIDATGHITRSRARTSVEGRAEFRGLGRSVSYWADINVDGTEQISSPLVLPPDSGISLLLSTLGPSANNGAQQDQLLATDQAPAGAVLVGIFNSDSTPADQSTVKLHKLGVGGSDTVLGGVRTPEQGRVVWDKLGVGPDDLLVVEAAAASGSFRSRPFHIMSGDKATGLLLVVSTPVMVGIHAGGQLEDQFLHFEAQYMIANATGAPLDYGEDGLKLPLPSGFAGAAVQPEKQNAVKVMENGLAWHGMIPPGQDTVSVSFSIPIHDGEAELEWKAPFGLAQWMIALDQVDGMTVDGPASSKQEVVTGQDGRPFVRFTPKDDNSVVSPGETLKFAFKGLPKPSPTFKTRRTIAVAVSALLLLAGLVVALLANLGIGSRRVTRRNELTRTIDRLYGELASLQARCNRGELSEPAHAKQRKAKVAELEKSLRELDQLVDEVTV